MTLPEKLLKRDTKVVAWTRGGEVAVCQKTQHSILVALLRLAEPAIALQGVCL